MNYLFNKTALVTLLAIAMTGGVYSLQEATARANAVTTKKATQLADNLQRTQDLPVANVQNKQVENKQSQNILEIGWVSSLRSFGLDKEENLGKQFTLKCSVPADLTPGWVNVWGGNNIYTADSVICKSAIHAGVITKDGGIVTVQLNPGQPFYTGIEKNGVISHDKPASDFSFSFVSNSKETNSQSTTTEDLTAQNTSVREELVKDLNADVTESEIIVPLSTDVLFDYDRSDIRDDAISTLEKLGQALSKLQFKLIEIAGHTDSDGSEAYNIQLSQQRAEAVLGWLVSNTDLTSENLIAKGYGETQPIAENQKPNGEDNPEGRAKNRRVEVIIPQ